MGIRIDALNAAASATGDHEIPAMKDGATIKLTVAQISEKVQSDLSDDLGAKAPLESPTFIGNPTAPTPSSGDSDESIATTAFVQYAVAINPLTNKTTPVDADQLRIADSGASNAAKKLTFANLWTWIRDKVLTLFNASGAAPVYACRAWVNFNGTGTVAIRASGNVSSITDNGAGDYTINFTTAMPDANYSIVNASSNYTTLSASPTLSASSARVYTTASNGTLADASYVGVCVFR